MRPVILFLLSVPAWAALAFVQAPAGATANATTVSASFAVLPTVGNYVVVGCTVFSVADTLLATDNQSNSYTKADTISALSAQTNVSYTKVATSSGTFTATCTNNGATFTAISIAEYSGVAASSPTDGTNHNSGTSTTVAPGSITTTNANDLIIGVGATVNATATWTATASYNLRGNTNTGGGTAMCIALTDRIVSATGTYSPNITSDANANFTGASMTLQAAAAASGTLTPGHASVF